MSSTVVFFVRLYLPERKNIPLPSASAELDRTLKSTILLHSHYTLATVMSFLAAALEAKWPGHTNKILQPDFVKNACDQLPAPSRIRTGLATN